MKLIIRIFVLYWIAVVLVILAITVLYPNRLSRVDLLHQALEGEFTSNASTAVQRYEQSRCSGNLVPPIPGTQTYLLDDSGRFLCNFATDPAVQELALKTAHDRGLLAANQKNAQLIAIVFTGSQGKRYVLVNRIAYRSHYARYSWMPGKMTIAVSCLVALFLALIFSGPIRRLRRTARKIAIGKLDSRVEQPGGKLLAKLLLGNDIHGLTTDFNNMADRLEALYTAQQLLLRDVSHELRTPLARLCVALELARDRAGQEVQPHLNRIDREINQLNNLISRLLSLSKMESMQSVERPSGLWLEHLLTEMQPDLVYESRDHCRLVLNKRGDCFVHGDAELIRSAIENVVRNAIRYSPHGSTIEITVSPEKPREAEYARIRIRDQGPGVPESELNEILKPFVRIDKSRRNSTGSFGVGLSIAKRVVELHGGEIQLHNGARSGLVVDLLFPFVPAPADSVRRSFVGSQAD